VSSKDSDSNALIIEYVDEEEGARILDRQARKYLNTSGEEFARAYREVEIPDPDRSEVIRVAMLLPFIGESSIAGQNKQSAPDPPPIAR
jgi:hypothetical protein